MSRRGVTLLVAVLTVAALPAVGADAPPPSATLLPPEARPALPDLPPLTGASPQDALERADLVGRVAVVNIWYEW